MIPKQTYIRSQKLLKAVASLPCQCCGHPDSQAAHSNWWGGKGKGIKASDEFSASLCLKCHWEIDQGNKLTKVERKQKWLSAHRRTVQELQRQGLWPVDIPIPEIEFQEP
jgi:hypothetical protein